MKKKDRARCLRCQYCGKAWSTMIAQPCEYLLVTGRSRIKAAMQTLGADRMTAEVEELLLPKNCPCFSPKPRKSRRTNPVTGVVRDA